MLKRCFKDGAEKLITKLVVVCSWGRCWTPYPCCLDSYECLLNSFRRSIEVGSMKAAISSNVNKWCNYPKRVLWTFFFFWSVCWAEGHRIHICCDVGRDGRPLFGCFCYQFTQWGHNIRFLHLEGTQPFLNLFVQLVCALAWYALIRSCKCNKWNLPIHKQLPGGGWMSACVVNLKIKCSTALICFSTQCLSVKYTV